MSILGRLVERRDLTFQTLWGSGADTADLVNADAGVRVDQKSALTLTAVYSCVSLLVDTISTLPVGVFRSRGAERIPLGRPVWMFQPEADNPSSSWETHLAEVMFSLLLDGNAFVWTVRDEEGEILELRALDPGRVEPKRAAGGIVYEVSGGNGVAKAVLDGTQVRHIWRLRRPGELRGISPVEAARQSLGRHLAAERFGARFFGQGATMSGYIKADAKLTRQQADELKAQFKAKHSGLRNAWDVGVLDAGAEWKQLSVTPEQAQFLATLEQGDEAVARLFRVPPPLAGITKPGAMAYASVEALLIAFEKFSVRPYVEAIETAYSPLTPRGQFVKLNTNGLLRGDFKTRMEGYHTGVRSGLLLRSEARALEEFGPLDGADEPLVPLELANPETADLNHRVDAFEKLVKAGVDAADAAKVVGLPPMKIAPKPEPVAPPPDAEEEPTE